MSKTHVDLLGAESKDAESMVTLSHLYANQNVHEFIANCALGHECEQVLQISEIPIITKPLKEIVDNLKPFLSKEFKGYVFGGLGNVIDGDRLNVTLEELESLEDGRSFRIMKKVILAREEALHYLASQTIFTTNSIDNQKQVIEILLSGGVGVNQILSPRFTNNQDDTSLLSLVASKFSIELVSHLLERGGVVTPAVLRTISSSVGHSNAEMLMAEELVTFLLHRGIDINMHDESGSILHGMHYWTSDIAETFMSFLLEHGADVHTTDNSGKTPLHITAKGYRNELVIILVKHGADIHQKDNNGVSAWDILKAGHEWSTYYLGRVEFFYEKYKEEARHLATQKPLQEHDVSTMKTQDEVLSVLDTTKLFEKNEIAAGDDSKDLEHKLCNEEEEHQSIPQELLIQGDASLKNEITKQLTLPEKLSPEQKALFKQIAIEVEEKYPSAPESFNNLVTIAAFNKYTAHQEQGIRIASAAALPYLGITTADLAAGTTIGAAIYEASSMVAGFYEYCSNPEFNQSFMYKTALLRQQIGMTSVVPLLEAATYHGINGFGYGVTIKPDGSYDVDVVTTHVQRESKEIRERKKEVKDILQGAAKIEAIAIYSEGRCNQYLAMPEEAIVQIMVDSADRTVPDILAANTPALWHRENVFGILKHSFAKHYLTTYNKECDDHRVVPEVLYNPGGRVWEPGDPLKGAMRMDAYAAKRQIVFDYKFGEQGVTEKEANSILMHMGPDAAQTVVEVRPSEDGLPNQRTFSRGEN